MELHRQIHVLMFPYPIQSHINPMMHLANKLLSSGFFVTFVNTDSNHQLMFDDEGGASQHLLRIPALRFEQLPDGLPRDRPVTGVEWTTAILSLQEPLIKLVEKMMRGPAWLPLTCVISDSFCSWMQDAADRLGVPRVSLWTTPVHANLVYLSQADLISQGFIPLKDKKKASEICMTCIPGVAPMALSEYPSMFLVEDSSDYLFNMILNNCMKRPNEAAWNLGNNLLPLEAGATEAFQRKVKNFLPIGPLLPESVVKGEGWKGIARLSLWTEEGECGEWLAAQKERSVLYISCGSEPSKGEVEGMEEMVKGVEESGVPFLWAARADQRGKSLEKLRRKLEEEGGGGRGKVVEWAPQIEVLCHKAVGGFLCHCGWNSVVESMCAGVPILAAPLEGFAEQKMNAHYVANVWQVGLPLVSPTPSKDAIASQICTLFGESAPMVDLRSRLTTIRRYALASLSPPSGASISNFQLFVEDMRRRSSHSSSSSSSSYLAA